MVKYVWFECLNSYCVRDNTLFIFVTPRKAEPRLSNNSSMCLHQQFRSPHQRGPFRGFDDVDMPACIWERCLSSPNSDRDRPRILCLGVDAVVSGTRGVVFTVAGPRQSPGLPLQPQDAKKQWWRVSSYRLVQYDLEMQMEGGGMD